MAAITSWRWEFQEGFSQTKKHVNLFSCLIDNRWGKTASEHPHTQQWEFPLWKGCISLYDISYAIDKMDIFIFRIWQTANKVKCFTLDNDRSSWPLNPGPLLLSGRTSYRKISWSFEAARLGVIMILSLCNLTGTSEALLSRCLSNSKAIGNV